MSPGLVVELLDKKSLTMKEAEVLKLICRGFTRPEMAAITFRCVGTVSRHVEKIAIKLDAHSAAEIVAKAIAMGIVSISLKITILPVLVMAGNYGL